MSEQTLIVINKVLTEHIEELEAAIRQHRDDVHLHLGNAHTDLDLKLYAALEEKK
jgi:hypothetical protein